jgi:hypothetical protein
VNHPYLVDPAHSQAFAALVANGYGTQRGWARAWGWTLPRVQRFLSALVRYQLAEIVTAPRMTIVRILPADGQRGRSDTNRYEPIQSVVEVVVDPVVEVVVDPPTLGTRYLDKQPRYLEAGSGFTETLINCMNAVLAERFGEAYRPVMHDNRASVAAATRMQTSGIDLAFAVAELRQGCWLFNPSKHGKGELPRSLAYFERGIVKAWGMRAQQQLALLSSAKGGAAAESQKPRQGGIPTPIADSIAELERSASDETTRAAARSWRATYAANGGAIPSEHSST